MIDIERREFILKQLEQYRIVKVTDLSRQLFIGEATIRRDLGKLEKEGFLKRIYGGAVYLNKVDQEIPTDIRRYTNTEKKQAIAALAADLIHDNQTIAIDSSTTCFFLAEQLKKFQNLTVFTHGLSLLEQLKYSNVNLYSSGGILSKHTLSYGGEFTRHFFSSFNTEIVFISCKGLSMTHDITYAYDEEAVLRRLMLQHSQNRVLLCDSTKFDRISTSRLFGFEMIDWVITDAAPSDTWQSFLREKGIRILSPEPK